MANKFKASVHQWYLRHGSAAMFRVVAVDNGSIEIQSFDGDIEELELEAWRDLDVELAEPPEDWTGPFDNIEADDLDDTEGAVRKGDGHAGVEPQLREEESWQDTGSEDEGDEEDDAEPYADDAVQPAKNKPH